MNTHDKYELPPLPQGYCANEIRPNYARQIFLENQVKGYARAAIEAHLQSQDRRDAERYRLLRDGQIDDIAVVRGLGATDYGSSGVIGIYEEEIGGDDLDEVIDHAQRIEGQA